MRQRIAQGLDHFAVNLDLASVNPKLNLFPEFDRDIAQEPGQG